MQILAGWDFDVAVIDRILSNGHSGTEIIEHISTSKPLYQTILITAYPTFESVQDVLKNGCCDYLIKPVAHGDIFLAVKKASEKSIKKRLEKAAYCL
jgi:two-component system, response regulator YesN